MHKKLTLACFLLFASTLALGALAANSKAIEGVYETQFNEMTLYLDGNKVSGSYKHRDGKIEGVLDGTRLVGTWTQSNGSGRLVFEFDSGFASFKGKWAYGEKEPSSDWNGKKLKSFNEGADVDHPLAGVYTTNFNEMTLAIEGNRVTGTYKHKGGKIEGILSGQKLAGSWVQTNGKGRLEFDFSADFSSFEGKWGYNNAEPSSRWHGNKVAGSEPVVKESPQEVNLPVNIAGSWSFNGSREQIGRVHIWQNGDDCVVIAAWPDDTTGQWKSYKGEGRLEGRSLVFKVFPSAQDGSSQDQGYVYHYQISPDNSQIRFYYTRHGQRTVNQDVYYKRVK